MNTFPFFNFFEFKNVETIKAITKVISENEGILPEKMGDYLFYAHVKKKAGLLIKAKAMINQFNHEHQLCLSDSIGIMHLALNDIEAESRKVGDQYVELHNKVNKK